MNIYKGRSINYNKYPNIIFRINMQRKRESELYNRCSNFEGKNYSERNFVEENKSLKSSFMFFAFIGAFILSTFCAIISVLYINSVNAHSTQSIYLIPVIILVIISISFLLILSKMFFFKLGLNLVDSYGTDLKRLFVTCLYCYLIEIIPFIGFFISAFIINKRHKTGYWKGLLVLFIAFVVSFIILVLIGINIIILISMYSK